MTILLVAAGGFLGAVCRYWVSIFFSSRTNSRIPYGTLSVNLIGSFLLGLLAGSGLKGDLYALSAIGFLGGFTTFSTLSIELVNMFKHKDYASFFFYLSISYFGGICCAFTGMLLIMAG
ncbi:fluoride efflux transporter FluC [Cytobacillus gottheilii]|uniref:Fluoride-specific ion channel FluC n=1 Tax=Cytobacillus gottheilii TaxID=859144 RepID=A0ABX8F7C4_9BACI|nr:CrcB family protein [Cytobacillus gottheilii]QVY59859.1 CrcB family protein [Cytobacillus gottheilii]